MTLERVPQCRSVSWEHCNAKHGESGLRRASTLSERAAAVQDEWRVVSLLGEMKETCL
jgi:hypothetical protein